MLQLSMSLLHHHKFKAKCMWECYNGQVMVLLQGLAQVCCRIGLDCCNRASMDTWLKVGHPGGLSVLALPSPMQV